MQKKKIKKFKTAYTNLVREPKLVVKSGRGARAIAAAAEAVVEQRRRANGTVRTFDQQCKETKAIKKQTL